MVVREILDELSALEKTFVTALRLLPYAQKREELQHRLESGLRRVVKTKTRIRACCKPMPVAAKYLPKAYLPKRNLEAA